MAEVATVEVDPYVKTAATKNVILDPIYYDDRAASALTVKGTNLLKQFKAAGIVPNKPNRDELIQAITTRGEDFSNVWREQNNCADLKL